MLITRNILDRALGSSEPEAPLALIGATLLQRYRIDQLVTRGGMSLVYRGYDTRLERRVAVKIFSKLRVQDQAYRSTFQQFVQEAFALSSLRHPNTLQIFDFAYLDKPPFAVPFQVSEYMDAGTLADWVSRNGPLSEMEALSFLEGIGGALEEAHAQGTIHRDVKPTNVLIGNSARSPIVKLADFGIAHGCAMMARAAPHIPGDTEGLPVNFFTPGWSAPEQFRALTVGPTADIYGLALLFVFMLTGANPCPHTVRSAMGADTTKLDAAMDRALAALELSPRVAVACAQACRAQPERRHQTIEEFLHAVRSALGKHEIRDRIPLDSAREAKATQPIQKPNGDTAAILGELGGAIETPLDAPWRLVEITDHITLGSADHAIDSGVRVQVTMLLQSAGSCRIHLRGMNCFMAKEGGGPTRGLDVAEDGEFACLRLDGERIATVRVRFASASDDVFTFASGRKLAFPQKNARHAVSLEFVPSGELFVVYRK